MEYRTVKAITALAVFCAAIVAVDSRLGLVELERQGEWSNCFV
ncbi:hypothetical protein SAMN04487969_106196 [Paenibacillus algorifonticola]|uniref:Uncharacterized protein n=1 Tax=Paenibacillus algorifonticola TaxID=684063 RepID=A0A1I2D998_9BACL|nr:hypothetical protein SAMN04487969_106196 [Paenibacillus algorifonticola]